MSDADIRKAHKLLDSLFDNSELSHAQIDLIRGLVPEPPAQMTLEEIAELVNEVRDDTYGNDWDEDMFGDLEVWLGGLHEQLQGLVPAKPAHPEFLETEADYQNAPEGTIVACEDSPPWHKFDSEWLSTAAYEGNSAKNMTGVIREVLRWGDGE